MSDREKSQPMPPLRPIYTAERGADKVPPIPTHLHAGKSSDRKNRRAIITGIALTTVGIGLGLLTTQCQSEIASVFTAPKR